MINFGMLPLPVLRFPIERAMQIGREIGESCPYWYDNEILEAITHEDKETKKMLKEKYKKQCHEPNVVYRPDHMAIYIKCTSCDCTSGVLCSRYFPLIAEKMLNELKKNLGSMNDDL